MKPEHTSRRGRTGSLPAAGRPDPECVTRRLARVLLPVVVAIACAADSVTGRPGQPDPADGARTHERDVMVTEQIEARGVTDPRVLAALRAVPRHRFVPAPLAARAYADTPLPIGSSQTISQPYVVAYMTEALALPEGARVLEVGTGSGYQAAVLAEIAREVFTIEILPELAARATGVLDDLGYDNIRVRAGDGYRGWAEEAPFDGILVAAAPDHVPPALVDQLGVGARLVIPVDRPDGLGQAMTIVTRTADGPVTETTLPVRFVPMTGEARGDR